MQKIRTSSNADVSFCGRLRREDQVGAGWEVGADGRNLMVLIFIPLILLAPLSVCLSVSVSLPLPPFFESSPKRQTAEGDSSAY